MPADGLGVDAGNVDLAQVIVAVEPGGRGNVVGAEGAPADRLVLHAQRPARGAVPVGGPAAGLVVLAAELGRGGSPDGEADRVELRAGDVAGQPPGYLLARAFPDESWSVRSLEQERQQGGWHRPGASCGVQD